MAQNSRLIPWLIGALALIVVGALVLTLPAVRDDLTERAEAALAAEGIEATVSFDGRDATISADGLTPFDQRRAVAIVEELQGVRVAEFVDEAMASATTTTVATAGGSGAVSTSEAPSNGTTTLAPQSSTTTTAVAAAGTPQLTASLVEGALVLQGAVPDAVAAQRIAAVADLIYGPFVSNELVVDESLDTASWVAGSANSVAVLPIVGSATLQISGESATITAVAPTETRAAQLQGALAAALGPEVALTADVTISGAGPPNFQADVPGDGTIALSGTVANEDVLRRIVGSAIQLYGEANVTSTMTVGENVDANFSMYRVPVALVPLSAFPQWELDIQDDVITGALRGGATFASGSAQLTDQLQQLLTVGAGILLRNPTLGMTIEGHTDSIGSEASNQALSEARAAAAEAFLTAAGVGPERLTALGYGESRPVASNDTASGRTLNRRVEFLLGPLPRGGG